MDWQKIAKLELRLLFSAVFFMLIVNCSTKFSLQLRHCQATTTCWWPLRDYIAIANRNELSTALCGELSYRLLFCNHNHITINIGLILQITSTMFALLLIAIVDQLTTVTASSIPIETTTHYYIIARPAEVVGHGGSNTGVYIGIGVAVLVVLVASVGLIVYLITHHQEPPKFLRVLSRLVSRDRPNWVGLKCYSKSI